MKEGTRASCTVSDAPPAKVVMTAEPGLRGVEEGEGELEGVMLAEGDWEGVGPKEGVGVGGAQAEELPEATALKLPKKLLSTRRRPRASTATAMGLARFAPRAGPPSPELPGYAPKMPVPAAVLIVPFGKTFLTLRLRKSAMNSEPQLSKARPLGEFRVASAAAPKSPLKPAVPVPTRVLMMPVARLIHLTRCQGVSEK